MIKAVIFDMDGLLIDSEPFWRRSHIEVLGKYGFVITEDDVRAHAGRRTDAVVRDWKEKFDLSAVGHQDLQDEIIGQVQQLVHLNGQALPGVYAVIELLEKHHIPLAVASSSPLELINTVLDKLGLRQHMKVIHSAHHEEFGKPHPAVFLTTAKKLGVKPEECLVFEDSLNGVKAAKAADMKCIAVPEHPHDPKKFQIADQIVGSLTEVNWPMIKLLY